jgi:hypothetical protein
MGPITQNLYVQIKSWRIYSIIMPAVFASSSALMYIFYGVDFQDIFYVGLVILAVTCISWWHWSLSSMLTMLAIMKDTDDHFDAVVKEYNDLKLLIEKGIEKNKTVVKPVDTLQ